MRQTYAIGRPLDSLTSGEENAKPIEYACTNAMATFQLHPGLGRGVEDRMVVSAQFSSLVLVLLLICLGDH